MNKELKEQARKEFDERFVSEDTIDSMNSAGEECYSSVRYVNTDSTDDFTYFIDSIIDKTVQHEQERIIGILNKHRHELDIISIDCSYWMDNTISLITNKNDINK